MVDTTATDCDSCYKALIDQMTRPDQDFPAWDRDDHTFLRWYIGKQLEILAASGRGTEYILPAGRQEGVEEGDLNATLATFQVLASCSSAVKYCSTFY